MDTVSTQNTDVQSAFSEDATYRISESDFVGEDIYGDIVFSMHKQCQNSYFLWRSHNTSDRTYAKTFVFDDAHIRLAPGGTGATCSP